MTRIRIGIVDSGYPDYQQPYVDDAAAFIIQDDALWQTEPEEDRLGHGTHILDSVRQICPESTFCLAQVFHHNFVTTTAQVVAAIDWLTEQKVDAINMSLGLRRNSPELAQSIQQALQAGIIISASSPAKGDPVYPAAYPGVFRMTGDARCSLQQWSWLETEYADFGGYVRSADEQQAGASMGTARMTGHISSIIHQLRQEAGQASQRFSPYEIRERLKAGSAFQGREYRTSQPDSQNNQ
ncbi:subtilisin-like serine protease QhpE [Oceanospirillum sediminis]|uniref:S8 family serine peptidase n=1 Tax=Oceanospirillum sediminis TaxID=2760088 RepID=A0A839IUA5_9GAMM|nr:S8 family serine peptidase [Oceanospirillum sediminis]